MRKIKTSKNMLIQVEYMTPCTLNAIKFNRSSMSLGIAFAE